MGACELALLAGESLEGHENVARVARHDGEWLAAHAAEVVRRTPRGRPPSSTCYA